jgi:hypothetical protein
MERIPGPVVSGTVFGQIHAITGIITGANAGTNFWESHIIDSMRTGVYNIRVGKVGTDDAFQP